MTLFAQWLDTVFASFDCAILSFYHILAETAGAFFTPFMNIISLSGEKGLLMFSIAFVLMLFKKTRKLGLCMFGAVCCGALLTSITIKPLVGRLRPFEASELYREFWIFTGSAVEDGFSFPSGHVTAAMAGSTALFLSRGKKYLWICLPYVILMGASRNYFAVHYPTDVIAAMIIGAISALLAFFIANFIYIFLEKHRHVKFFSFVLDFDVVKTFSKNN